MLFDTSVVVNKEVYTHGVGDKLEWKVSEVS